MKKSSTVIRVIKYISRYTPLMVTSLVMALITVAGQLYIPILQGNAIDKIIDKGQVDIKGIMQIALIILITTAVVAIFQWIMNIINNKITYSVIKDIMQEYVSLMYSYTQYVVFLYIKIIPLVGFLVGFLV